MYNFENKTEETLKPRPALGAEVGEKMRGYIATAFGLVAGLAWNEAIKAAIEYVFPLSKNTLLAKFFYALAVTFLVVYLIRLLGHEGEVKG